MDIFKIALFYLILDLKSTFLITFSPFFTFFYLFYKIEIRYFFIYSLAISNLFICLFSYNLTYLVYLRYLWYTSTILLAYTRHTLLIHSSYTRHTLRLFFSMFFYLLSYFLIRLFSIDWLLFCAKMVIIVVFGGFCMSWFIL